MLRRCFNAHTASIACALQPDIILLSGSATHSFAADFSRRLPLAPIEPMLHYAHRKGDEIDEGEHSRIRKVLAAAVAGKRA